MIYAIISQKINFLTRLDEIFLNSDETFLPPAPSPHRRNLPEITTLANVIAAITKYNVSALSKIDNISTKMDIQGQTFEKSYHIWSLFKADFAILKKVYDVQF